jgi:hypothetical protein
MFIKYIIFCKIVFAVDAHIAEGQVLREDLTINKGKSLKFRIETRIPTVLSKEGKNLNPL